MSDQRILNQWLTRFPGIRECISRVQPDSKLVVPALSDITHALHYVVPKDIRVVVIGQDPYHSVDAQGQRKANGLAFGYHPDYMGPIDSGMRAIITEIDAGSGWDQSLIPWARQGVLLLNSYLSGIVGEPLGYLQVGWPVVTSQIVRYLYSHTECVMLGWGTYATGTLRGAGVPLDNVDRVLLTSHPFGGASTRGLNPFRGSMWHHWANNQLQRLGYPMIDWLGTQACNGIEIAQSENGGIISDLSRSR